jgi:hypothetical protein
MPGKKPSLRLYLSVIGLATCLLLLTGMNFFVYPTVQSVAVTGNQKPCDPGGPVEEKPAPAANSLQEEYLHEAHHLELPSVEIKTNQPMLYHYAGLPDTIIEYTTPPPKLS